MMKLTITGLHPRGDSQVPPKRKAVIHTSEAVTAEKMRFAAVKRESDFKGP
jgi:hypothetical protein